MTMSTVGPLTEISLPPYFSSARRRRPDTHLLSRLNRPIPAAVFTSLPIDLTTSLLYPPRLRPLCSPALAHSRSLKESGRLPFRRRSLRRSESSTEKDLGEKLQKYEEFVEGRLKPDLVKAIAQRDKVFQQQKVFSDLKHNIEKLEQNGMTSLRTMVNLGSEVYMQADVPDTRHIFVDVGLGFHVEFTWSEALQFISVKEARLSRQIEEYTHLIADIKSQIKLVCEGIRELLQLQAE